MPMNKITTTQHWIACKCGKSAPMRNSEYDAQLAAWDAGFVYGQRAGWFCAECFEKYDAEMTAKAEAELARECAPYPEGLCKLGYTPEFDKSYLQAAAETENGGAEVLLEANRAAERLCEFCGAEWPEWLPRWS